MKKAVLLFCGISVFSSLGFSKTLNLKVDSESQNPELYVVASVLSQAAEPAAKCVNSVCDLKIKTLECGYDKAYAYIPDGQERAYATEYSCSATSGSGKTIKLSDADSGFLFEMVDSQWKLSQDGDFGSEGGVIMDISLSCSFTGGQNSEYACKISRPDPQ